MPGENFWLIAAIWMGFIKIPHPARGLVDYTSEIGADLLLVGRFLGTPAEKVMRHAPGCVYIVR